jgi:hypothetical protein
MRHCEAAKRPKQSSRAVLDCFALATLGLARTGLRARSPHGAKRNARTAARISLRSIPGYGLRSRTSPPDARPRESIEIRTFAFF